VQQSSSLLMPHSLATAATPNRHLR
jgi:hypothetical protein